MDDRKTALPSIDTQEFRDMMNHFLDLATPEHHDKVECMDAWGGIVEHIDSKIRAAVAAISKPEALPVADKTTEREAFEARSRTYAFGIERDQNDSDRYQHWATNLLFTFWQDAFQAGRASLATPDAAAEQLPARRFVSVEGFFDADYVEFAKGEPMGGGVVNGIPYASRHYSRKDAESFVRDGDWREVSIPVESTGLTDAQISTIRFAAEALEGLDYEDTACELRAILASTKKAT